MSTTNTEDSMRWGQPHDAALRRQVEQAIYKAPGYIATDVADATDAVLVVFAERERVLRERIEALPEGLRKGDVRLADVLSEFDNTKEA